MSECNEEEITNHYAESALMAHGELLEQHGALLRKHETLKAKVLEYVSACSFIPSNPSLETELEVSEYYKKCEDEERLFRELEELVK